MAQLNFPDPSVQQTYTEAGITWTWNAQLNVWSTECDDKVQPGDGKISLFTEAGSKIEEFTVNQTNDTVITIPSTGGGGLGDYTYPGGVTRAAVSRLEDYVSVKDFGATGNGSSDDTAAIQAALNSSAKGIAFPEGRYKISSTLTSTVNDRYIYGSGVITASSAVATALEIKASRNTVSLNIDGNQKIAIAISVSAETGADVSNTVIRDCFINNLYSTSGTCAGIVVSIESSPEGPTIINNVIKNANSPNAFSRGIQVRVNNSSLKSTVTISGNTLENIIGKEGDSISVINSNRNSQNPTFYKMPCVITNNRVVDFTRRGVKIQCSGVRVFNNYFSNYWTADNPQFQAVIDMVQGDNHQIIGNSLYQCKYMGQIKVNTGGEELDNIIVKDNLITGLGSETKNTLIYLKTYGNGLVVENNTIDCRNYNQLAFDINTGGVKKAYVNSNVIVTGGTKYKINAGNVPTLFPMGIEGQESGGDGGIEEAPANGQLYGRKNRTWERVPSIIPEPNNDGKQYARKFGEWVTVTAALPDNIIANNVRTGNPAFSSNSSSDVGCRMYDNGAFIVARSSTNAQNACVTLNRMSINDGRFINFYLKGSQRAYIAGDGAGGVTNVVNTSDYRTKENVKELPSAVDAVKALRPVTFNYIGTSQENKGFIAHELQAVEPLAAYGEKDGDAMQTVDTTKLIPILTKALQEALERIEILEGERS